MFWDLQKTRQTSGNLSQSFENKIEFSTKSNKDLKCIESSFFYIDLPTKIL